MIHFNKRKTFLDLFIFQEHLDKPGRVNVVALFCSPLYSVNYTVLYVLFACVIWDVMLPIIKPNQNFWFEIIATCRFSSLAVCAWQGIEFVVVSSIIQRRRLRIGYHILVPANECILDQVCFGINMHVYLETEKFNFKTGAF